MSSSRMLRALVQALPTHARMSSAVHAKPAKGRRKTGTGSGSGTLVLRVVSWSILQKRGLDTAPDVTGALFEATVTPLGARGRRAKKVVGPPFPPMKLAAGEYVVDIVQKVQASQVQAHPAGACRALVAPGKDTKAIVVLATDTLSQVARACGFEVGAFVGGLGQFDTPTPGAPPDPELLTIQNDFDYCTVGVLWQGKKIAGGGNDPTQPDPGTIQAATSTTLAAWSTQENSLMWANGANTPPEVNSGGAYGSGDRALALVETYMRNAMHEVLQRAPKVHEWVAVNEIFNIGIEAICGPFWENLHAHEYRNVSERRVELAKRCLRVAHSVQKTGRLLVSDYLHELYLPGRPRAKGKVKAQITKLQRRFNDKARKYRALLAAVRKDAALRGHVGVGYQMHVLYMKDFLANRALYKKALRIGISTVGGAPVVITEMAVGVCQMLPKSVFGSPPRPPPNAPPPSNYATLYQQYLDAYQAWLAKGVYGDDVEQPPPQFRDTPAASPVDPVLLARWQQAGGDPTAVTLGGLWWAAHLLRLDMLETLFTEKYGYGADPSNRLWQEQAQVFRDIVGTALQRPNCKKLGFWMLVDVPGDDLQDLHGHLFHRDAGTPGVYPAGQGLKRKPAYYGVLNGLIDAGYAIEPDKVPNWMRRFSPA